MNWHTSMTVVASSKTIRSVLAVNPENHGVVWICRLKVEGLGRRWRLCIELWRCLSATKCLAHSQRLVLAVVLLWFCGIFAPIHLAEVATRSCHSVVAYSVACGRQGATTICFAGCFKVCAATPATIFCCWVPRVDHRCSHGLSLHYLLVQFVFVFPVFPVDAIELREKESCWKYTSRKRNGNEHNEDGKNTKDDERDNDGNGDVRWIQRQKGEGREW